MAIFRNPSIFSQLVNISLVIGFALFGPWAILTTARAIGVEPDLWVFVSFAIWNFLNLAFLLGYFVPYVLFCAGIMVMAAAAILNRNVATWKRVLLGILAMGVTIFTSAPYQPAVSAAAGYELVVPTAPSLAFRGLKRAQAIGEVKPCVYEILGWYDDALFYGATCGQEETTWQFVPNEMSRPIQFQEATWPNLMGKRVPHTEVLDQFQSYGVFPKHVEPSVRSLYIQGTAIFSPDEEWVAVVSRYIYGVEDVVLVRSKGAQYASQQ